MSPVYHVSADRIDYNPIELRPPGQDGYVLFGRIAFLPDPDRKPKHLLYLNREWVVDGRVERYEGPVAVVIDGAEAEEGVVLAELGRDHLRLELDAEAAERIEDDEVRVEFDLDDAEFDRLRRELAEMFAGLGVFRDAGNTPVGWGTGESG